MNLFTENKPWTLSVIKMSKKNLMMDSNHVNFAL